MDLTWPSLHTGFAGVYKKMAISCIFKKNASCPQQKQTEGTYRNLLVPLNNRTVYQRNNHFLLWNKKTVQREKTSSVQWHRSMIPNVALFLSFNVSFWLTMPGMTYVDLRPLAEQICTEGNYNNIYKKNKINKKKLLSHLTLATKPKYYLSFKKK